MEFDYAERARALVGTPFRPQGRSAEGLDCVGVAMASYGLASDSVRNDYRLRGDHEAELRAFLASAFQRVDESALCAGDLMLMQVSSDQLHIGIRTDGGFVHADAMARRVVETPGLPTWRVLGVYRMRRE